MTRRIDWRDGATKAEKAEVATWSARILRDKLSLKTASAARKRLISRCYQKAARAAKGRK